MSRIIVKNLPKNITEDKLRKIFGESGLLTDIQLKYTPEGKFRQFAFLGFQNEEEAGRAIQHFNNTCIQTNRITVELCATLGDANKPKAWSKYAKESSAFKKLHPEKEEEVIPEKDKKEVKVDKKVEKLKKYKDDPLFEEFLQVHNAKEVELLKELKSKGDEDSDQDDEEAADSGVSEEDDGEEEKQEKIADLAVSDKEYMNILMGKEKPPVREKKAKEKKDIKLFNLKLRNLPVTCKKKDIKDFFKPNTPFSIRIPRHIKGIAFVGFKTEKQFKKGLMKDKSILGGKSISVTKCGSSQSESMEQDPKKLKWMSQEEKLKNEEDIGESGRIFIRNLAYITTEDDIQNLFSKYGPLTEVNLPIDSTTRKPKGFGVVTFLMPEHAVKAYAELDGTVLKGRMLHLLPGLSKDKNEDDIEESSNYKKQKAKKEKEKAGSSHNWNSLFLGHDAVAEVMANTYGTSKNAILDPHGNSNAAVRLALGETQIVAATRKYLETEGVVLDAFSGPVTKRSKTIILVKNLPANTEIKELRELFQPHGVIGRIILPPSGISAIVEFIEPSEARKAFTRLAYSKFKNLPLYLEWAPENSLNTKPTANSKDMKKDGTNTTKNETEVKAESSEDEEKEEEVPEEDTTLFVKNLNFETTDSGLRKHFESCGKIHYATVAIKKDKADPTKKLSMGYGFVRFMHKNSADKALKDLQGSSLDGKTLELKRSERTLSNEVTAPRKATKKTKQTGSKILVRNVPFQATKKEIFELFKTFGEIKALRLPMKMAVGANTHRGFAFIDYFTQSEAKKAFEALSQSTHLYGRRLVLEWASADDGVEELRKRTADHFHTEDAPQSKKSVFNIDDK